MKIFYLTNHINAFKSSKFLYYLHFHGFLSGNFTFQKTFILKYSNDMCRLKFYLICSHVQASQTLDI